MIHDVTLLVDQVPMLVHFDTIVILKLIASGLIQDWFTFWTCLVGSRDQCHVKFREGEYLRELSILQLLFREQHLAFSADDVTIRVDQVTTFIHQVPGQVFIHHDALDCPCLNLDDLIEVCHSEGTHHIKYTEGHPRVIIQILQRPILKQLLAVKHLPTFLGNDASIFIDQEALRVDASVLGVHDASLVLKLIEGLRVFL